MCCLSIFRCQRCRKLKSSKTGPTTPMTANPWDEESAAGRVPDTGSSSKQHARFVMDEEAAKKQKKERIKRVATGLPGKRQTSVGPDSNFLNQEAPRRPSKQVDIFYVDHHHEPIPLGRAL